MLKMMRWGSWRRAFLEAAGGMNAFKCGGCVGCVGESVRGLTMAQ